MNECCDHTQNMNCPFSSSNMLCLENSTGSQAEVGKDALKSNGDEALNVEFLFKSDGDEALNYIFP